MELGVEKVNEDEVKEKLLNHFETLFEAQLIHAKFGRFLGEDIAKY